MYMNHSIFSNLENVFVFKFKIAEITGFYFNITKGFPAARLSYNIYISRIIENRKNELSL